MANVVPQQRKEEDALVVHLEEVAIAGSTKDKIEDYPFFASIYYGGYLFTHTVHPHSSFLTEDGKDLLRQCRNVCENMSSWHGDMRNRNGLALKWPARGKVEMNLG